MTIPFRKHIAQTGIELMILILSVACESNNYPEFTDYTGLRDSITDIDGNVYKTVGIGTQIWMAQNLKTTRYNDGTGIPLVNSDSIWTYTNSPAYCWYSNDSTINRKVYGALYNFYTVETELLCPPGWHVPTKEEWERLGKFLGGIDIAGAKLKDYYTFCWNGPNPCVINTFSFSALPGGERFTNGIFKEIGDRGNWWTSTNDRTYLATYISMNHESKGLSVTHAFLRQGFSVRCIKNKY